MMGPVELGQSLRDALGQICLEAATLMALGAAALLLIVAVAAQARISAGARRGLWIAAFVALAALVAGETGGLFAALGAAASGRDDPAPPRLPVAPSRTIVSRDARVEAPTSSSPARPPDRPFTAPSAEASDEKLDAAAAPELAADATPADRRSALPWRFWAGIAWLAGACLLAGRVALSWLLLQIFRARLRPSGVAEMVEALATLRRALGVRRSVALLEAAAVRGPLTFGLLRPTIVVPRAFGQEIPRGQCEVVLAHELAHVARWDAAALGLSDLVAAALWWHPLVWWARHRLRCECEFAADEASASIPNGPQTLAECLVRLGARWLEPAPRGELAAGGSGSILARRVQRLLGLESRAPLSFRPHLLVTSSAALALVAAVACGASWAHPQNSGRGDLAVTQPRSHRFSRSLAGLLVAFVLQQGKSLDAQEAPGGTEDGEAPSTTPRPAAPTTPAQPKAPRAAATPGAPGAAPAPAKPAAGFGDAPNLPPSVPAPGPAAGPPRRGESAQPAVDLVALATAVSDALEALDLARLEVDNTRRHAATGVVSQSESEKAEIRLRAAERKLSMYERIAAASLRAIEEQLEAARFGAFQFGDGSGLPESFHESRAREAHFVGQREILREIFGQTRAGQQVRQAGTKAVESSHFLVQLDDTVDLDALEKKLTDTKAADDGPTRPVIVVVAGTVPAAKVADLLRRLERLGLQDIHLRPVEGSKAERTPDTRSSRSSR